MDVYIWRCFSFFLDYSPLDSHHFSFIAAWLSSFTYCSNLLFFMSALGDNCTTTVIPTTNTLQTTGAQVCSAAPGGNVVQVRFTGDFGDVPLLVGDAIHLKHGVRAVKFVVKEEIRGDKEDAYCADRGLCNTRVRDEGEREREGGRR